MLISCSALKNLIETAQETIVTAQNGKVQFTFNIVNPGIHTARFSTQAVTNQIPAWVQLSIQDLNSSQSEITNTKVGVQSQENGLYTTDQIELKSGVYALSGLMVLNSNNEVIYIAPTSTSNIGSVLKLPLNFHVAENNTEKVTANVVSVSKTDTPAVFGYSNFELNLINMFNFYIGLRASNTNDYVSANIKIICNRNTIYTGTVQDSITKINLRSDYPNYEITISKTNYQDLELILSQQELSEIYSKKPLILKLNSTNSQTKNSTENNNVAPTADAGPNQTVIESALVTLFGSNSLIPANAISNFSWSQINGKTVQLSSTTAINPTFIAPKVSTESTDETLSFKLTLTANQKQSTDICTVKVTKQSNIQPIQNHAPQANAGTDQIVDEETKVFLDGFNSKDSYDGIVSYLWTQTSGTTVTLADSSAVQTNFTAPKNLDNDLTLTFQLTVTDMAGNSGTASCTVLVKKAITYSGNQPPKANAGPDQNVESAKTVHLSGINSSDPENKIAFYKWEQTSGPAVTLYVQNQNATFTAPTVTENKTLVFKLTVKDEGNLESIDSCIVNVIKATESSNPTESIWPAWSSNGVQYKVGDKVIYQDKVYSCTLDHESAPWPWYIPSDKGIPWKLTDDSVSKPSTPQNQAPIAHAGSDQIATENTTVNLDGSSSTDADNTIISYTWTKTDGPSITFSSSNTAKTSFTAPQATSESGYTITLKLTVKDTENAESSDTCVIKVIKAQQTQNTPQGEIPQWSGNGVGYTGATGSDFSKASKVMYNNKKYYCWQSHTSQPTYTPESAPSLWITEDQIKEFYKNTGYTL